MELALTLFPGNPLDDAIARGLDLTGLDSRNPSHWKLLLAVFCIAHFGEWKKHAAPKEWTRERLKKLLADTAEIESSRPPSLPKLSDTALSKILSSNAPYSSTYGSFEIDSLRERIREARKYKEAFAAMLEKHLKSVQFLYEAAGLDWTPEVIAQVSMSFTKNASEML
jgi:hypothetical protein